MIHPSKRWRYVQEIDDKGFYEDEMVIHHLTGLRAFRRSFSAKFSADEKAVQAVLDQMKLAARSQATMLPFVFVSETVKDRLTIVMELVEGQSVLDLMTKRTLSKPREWAKFTQQLIKSMIEARKVGARFERLAIEHMIFTANGELHLTRRFPMGKLPREEIESSQYLERLDMITDGGVYTSIKPADEKAEMRVLSELLCKVASGSAKSTINSLRNEVKANPSYHSSPLASIEREIAEVILRMTPSGEGGKIYSFEQLAQVLEPMANPPKQERISPVAAASPPDTGTPHPAPLPGGPVIPPSGVPASMASPTPTPAPPTPPADFSQRDDTISNPFEVTQIAPSQQQSAPSPQPVPSTPPPPTPESLLDEEVNPYASDSHPPVMASPALKETATPPGANDSKFPGAVSSQQPPTVVKEKKTLNPAFLLWGVVGIIALALIGGGIVFTVSLLKGSDPNSPPVAEFVEMEKETYKINEEVLFNGSASRDIDDDPITYSWTLVRPTKSSIIFTDPETNFSKEALTFLTKTPKVIINFQNQGPHEIRLQVNDGNRYSQPVIQKVTIVP